MIDFKTLDKPTFLFLIFAAISLFLPIGTVEGQAVYWTSNSVGISLVIIALAVSAIRLLRKSDSFFMGVFVVAGTFVGAFAILSLIKPGIDNGFEAPGLWMFVFGLGFLAWRAMSLSSLHADKSTIIKLLVPTFFGLWILYLWQILTTGFQIPSVLLPSPALIGLAIVGNTDILIGDFYQTFMKSVLSGYALGCGSGFLVAVLVDKIPFLQRGLLPLGSLVSAIPIVGIAPIMVMWFGFDWQSKAAVIVIMTFFPMLVNTLAGLEATSHLEKDLMRSYAASYLQTLIFVRLPNALPFIFNALKINSTLALIGAIVAEFFGTPIVGMGFRISTEVGRMNVDIVWATIAVAAVAGSVSYGALALLERSMTFWHPSYRSARS